MTKTLDTSIWLDNDPWWTGKDKDQVCETPDDVVVCADTSLSAAKAALGDGDEIEWNFGSIRGVLREMAKGEVSAYEGLTSQRRAELLTAIGRYALELANEIKVLPIK